MKRADHCKFSKQEICSLSNLPLDTVFNSSDLVALHRSLQRINGINLGDDHPAAETSERLGAALTDISIAGDHGDLASQHHISGALDTVDQGLPAAIQVVELRLGDGVVDIDGGDLESSRLGHLVKVMHAGGGLLGNTLDAFQILGVLLMDEVGQVASVVEDHVEGLTIWEDDSLLNAPNVPGKKLPSFQVANGLYKVKCKEINLLLVGLSLPGVDRDAAGCHGGGGVILDKIS